MKNGRGFAEEPFRQAEAWDGERDTEAKQGVR